MRRSECIGKFFVELPDGAALDENLRGVYCMMKVMTIGIQTPRNQVSLGKFQIRVANDPSVFTITEKAPTKTLC